MNRRIAFFVLFFCATLSAFSQGDPNDVRKMQLFAFGGATGTYTGLDGGKNLGISAGVDLGFGPHYGVLPLIEARGIFPVSDGSIVAEKSFLVGLKVEKPYGRLHPYVNFLFGRGQLQYQGAGFLNPDATILYQKTNSNVLSPGGGLDFDLTPSIAFKVDIQYQSWKTPVTTSGSINSVPITIGAVYRFGYSNSRPY